MTVMNFRTDGPIGGHLPRADKPGQAKPGRFAGADESDPNWRNRAACRDEPDKERWFPIGNTGPALLQIEDAKAVCNNRCPVRDDCLTWALTAGEDAGVWGGMSEDERRALKRRAARARSRMAEQNAQDAQASA